METSTIDESKYKYAKYCYHHCNGIKNCNVCDYESICNEFKKDEYKKLEETHIGFDERKAIF